MSGHRCHNQSYILHKTEKDTLFLVMLSVVLQKWIHIYIFIFWTLNPFRFLLLRILVLPLGCIVQSNEVKVIDSTTVISRYGCSDKRHRENWDGPFDTNLVEQVILEFIDLVVLGHSFPLERKANNSNPQKSSLAK